MSSGVIVDNHHIYQAHEQDTLLSEVVSAVCILLPRAFAIAGFSASGKVLIVKYNSYENDRAAWDPAFFEYEFLNEPLLAMPSQLKGLFVGSEHTLTIPYELYDPGAVNEWMSTIHHMEAGSLVDVFNGRPDKLRYAFTIPKEVQAMASRYFETAQVLPLATYHFFKQKTRKDAYIQCFVGDNYVVASLRNNGQLLWHQVFGYTTATDIAWQFTHLCKHYHIHVIDLNIEATAPSDSFYDTLLELETFYPKITWSERQMKHEGHWAPAIFLMQQLHQCVL